MPHLYRFLIVSMILLFWQPGSAQNTKQLLAGDGHRQWTESSIAVDEDGDWADSEEDFDMDEELIKYIPYAITFHVNGECEMVYQVELYEDFYKTVNGRWRTSGNDVFISQNDGRNWSMKVLSVEKGDNPYIDELGIDCGVTIKGLRVGVDSVFFSWTEEDDDEEDDGGK